MALLLEREIERGEKVTYWRWIQQNRSDLMQECNYVLGGWKDMAERQAYPRQPRVLEAFSFNGSEYPFDPTALNMPGMNDCCVAYMKVKASVLDADGNETNPFATAEDV